MKRARGRLLVASLAVVAAAIAVTGGGAGNRVGTPTLVPVPGPGAVSYGENIAYTATFTNEGSSTFTHVTLKMAPPVVKTTGQALSFVAASCGSVDSSGVLTCDFGQLASKGVERLTVVWKAPDGTASSAGCTGCIEANATWLINENKTTNDNETFTLPEPVKADLIGTSATEPVNKQLRAGGYETAGCTAGGSSLSTDQAVTKNNPVATSFCLPNFSVTETDLGLATTITETAGDAHTSEVCVAALGQNCPAGTRADFSPTGGVIAFTFLVSADALPKNYKITKVFHDTHEVTATTCSQDKECVVSIKLDKKTNVWTIVTTAKSNGPWSW
jgi:hypothetical protein